MRALASLMELAAQGCGRCWCAKVSTMLARFWFSPDRLPSPPIDLSQTLKESLIVIRDVIYRAFI